MSRWIKLVDAMQEDAEIYRKYVEYTPINSVEGIILKKEYTGWKEDQAVVAEDLLWHPILIAGKPCLISKETNFELVLQGEAGALNHRECLRMYSTLYSDEVYETNVKPLNEEIYKKLPEFIKNEVGNCWLVDTYETSNIMGAKSTWYKKVHDSFLQYKGEDDKVQINYYGYRMCLVIELPENILVNIDNPVWDGSCYEKALKISDEECEVEDGKKPETQEDMVREKIMEEMKELDIKQLKNLYQYISMLRK